jgi:hypothetical protein
LIAFVALAFLAGCASEQTVTDDAEKLVELNGRVGLDSPGRVAIYWPGSSVKTKFVGSALKAILRDQRGQNYFNVIVDDDSVYRLKLDTLKKEYIVVSGLAEGEHTVELFRLTDWNDGVTWFYGFQYQADAKILPVPPKTRRIEFYGNSITVGSAIEDYNGDSGKGEFTNNYLSYGAVTARHYNAAYTCIARSGIGLMVSWFTLIMPDMYARVNPFDSTSVWDFSKATPDIVVVNLMQNDYALSFMPEYDQFKKRFGSQPLSAEFIVTSYRNFISKLRDHYPDAHIICVLGNMDATRPGSPWPGYIEQAVASLHDPKMHTHFFPFKNTEGHPDVEEHRMMADSLIKFIDSNIKW